MLNTNPQIRPLIGSPGSVISAAQRLYGKAVFALDARLQKSHGVFCYTSDPACIFRISVTKLEAAVLLDNGIELPKGSPIAGLHLWNEQLPLLTKDAGPIAWGLQMSRKLGYSLWLLSRYFALCSEYGCVLAIRADMAFGTAEQTAQLLRICGRYGFIPSREPNEDAAAVHRIGENILISMMVLARNVGALRVSSLRRDRVRVFLTRNELDRRFGNNSALRNAPEAAS